MDTSIFSDVLETLAHGKPLTGLPLALHDGRIDLRRTSLSTLGFKRHFGAAISPQAGGSVGAFAGIVEPCVVPLSLRGIELRDMDFSGSHLDGVRFFNCTIRNCVFDDASCEDWRIWATSLSDTSFARASLRGAALGGLLDGERNRFENVIFANTDLRGTAYTSAVFLGCTFDNANLLKVDFQGSSFVRCVFRGELREVLFYDQGFKGEGLPANTMDDVDFSGAILRSVEFRKLNLDNVKLPTDGDHFVLRGYSTALDYALDRLREADDALSKRMRAYLAFRRKWIGPMQNVGVFNRRDVLEFIGEDGLRRLESLLHESSCRNTVN